MWGFDPTQGAWYSLAHMATNVEVEKNQSESTANLIRRFTKRMQGAGIVQKMRKRRYFKRIKSGNVQKNARLIKLKKKARYEELVKLGKIQEHHRR